MNRLFLLIFVCFFSACSTISNDVIRASASKLNLFLPMPKFLMENRERAPFNAYWVKDPDEYDKIKQKEILVYAPPVNTQNYIDYLKEQGEDDLEDKISEVEELASYFHSKLYLSADALKSPEYKVMFTDSPEDADLQLNLAITEVEPTSPEINLLGTILGFFVPGGGLVKSVGKGSIAIEAYVAYNHNDEDVWEQFKDRESHKLSAFTFKDYQKYAHIRVALDDWAMQIIELLSTDSKHKVEDSSIFSLSIL